MENIRQAGNGDWMGEVYSMHEENIKTYEILVENLDGRDQCG